MQNNKDIHINIHIEGFLGNTKFPNHNNNNYISLDKIDIDQIIRSIKIKDNLSFYDKK